MIKPSKEICIKYCQDYFFTTNDATFLDELVKSKPLTVSGIRFYDSTKVVAEKYQIPFCAMATEDAARKLGITDEIANVKWSNIKEATGWQENIPVIRAEREFLQLLIYHVNIICGYALDSDWKTIQEKLEWRDDEKNCHRYVGDYASYAIGSISEDGKHPNQPRHKELLNVLKKYAKVYAAWNKATKKLAERLITKEKRAMENAANTKVYALLLSNLVVKIGISADVKKRVKNFNQASHVVDGYYTRQGFTTVQAREIERNLHTRFASKRKYQSGGSPEYFIYLPFETACDALREFSDLIRLEVNHENHSPCLAKIQRP